MFVHESLEYPELKEDYDSPLGRHYTVPNGKRYPSVTTILGLKPKPALAAWEERVGADAADRRRNSSAKVGSEFHDACERYVKNEEVGVLSRGATMLFNSVRPQLKKHLGTVLGTEIPMWSDYLKLAGRSDLIADWDGETSIIDYKNSRNAKPIDFCEGYFEQGACYAKMLHERHGIVAKQMVIVIGVWGSPRATVHIQRVSDWYPRVIDHMKTYHPMWQAS